MSDAINGQIRLRMEQAMRCSGGTSADLRELCRRDVNAKALGQLHEQISAEAAMLVQMQTGPSPLIQILCDLELYPLCAMAAEAHHHATIEWAREKVTNDLARRCPMVIFKKVLHVSPVGELDSEALRHIADRALQIIARNRIKKVILILHGLTVDNDTGTSWITLLNEDLNVLKIQLQVLRD
ncbi:MAG: hypothetical protein JXR76_13295 [Deltaproteobacteria bacterium]|nr:hypothetical protein [Deltaproteobacteria bacterium]